MSGLAVAVRLTIPKNEITHFATVRDLGAAILDQLVAALEPVGPMVSVRDFERRVDGVVGAELAQPVMTALLTLASACRTNVLPQIEFVDAATADLRRRPAQVGWTKEQVDVWETVSHNAARVLSLDAVVVLEKSLNLAYAFPRLFRSARMLTDVRPIFNADGEEVSAAVVTHTLEVTYVEDRTLKTIRFAVDGADLELLREIADRADRKALAAQRWVSATGVPNVVAGQDGTDE